MFMVRRDATSPGLPEAMERFERLALTWPDDAWGWGSRALAAQFLRTPNNEEALRCYKLANEKRPCSSFYVAMLSCFADGKEQIAQGIEYYTGQRERLERNACGLAPRTQDQTIGVLTQLIDRLRAMPRG